MRIENEAPVDTAPVMPVSVDAMAPAEIGPGVWVRELPGTGAIRPWVVDIAPGAEWPELDVHAGYGEAYFVVEGEVIEGERRYGPGTYVFFEPGSSHRPRSERGARVFGFNFDAPETDA
ncbi:cupin domain-containing protein [Nocardia sp. NPDC050710]|uniref:cupin domain-containing protein n=1 Tax=Nocardia sp. NPDC050710 TaxID=3157220 RepID=UPI0033C25DF8